ncbi:MAG: hypothetical protein OEW75_16110 [Cyclobacteriaceae bacterium]|nr:hypothetical protein [Cyclobacteriaceae bacterium]
MSKELLVLVGVAAILAVPLAWLGVWQWLQNYGSKVSLHPIWLIGHILAVFRIAVLTVISQTFRIVINNPVNHLRNE